MYQTHWQKIRKHIKCLYGMSIQIVHSNDFHTRLLLDKYNKLQSNSNDTKNIYAIFWHVYTFEI